MRGRFLSKSPLQTAAGVTAIFMVLNILLPLNPPAKVEASHWPFKLTMMVEKTNFEIGEPVNVTLTLENIANETITIYYSRDHRFSYIYDQNNIKVCPVSYVVAMMLVPIEMEPGEVIYVTYTWKQYYIQSEIAPNYQQVRPGRYRIIGTFYSPTFDYLTVETPPITITIGWA